MTKFLINPTDETTVYLPSSPYFNLFIMYQQPGS
jgi:hypothetical protein